MFLVSLSCGKPKGRSDPGPFSPIRAAIAIFFGEMAFQVHTVVQDPADLDLTVVTGPVQEEMSRTQHPPNGSLDTVATTEKMVGPCRRIDLRAGVASLELRAIGDIHVGKRSAVHINTDARNRQESSLHRRYLRPTPKELLGRRERLLIFQVPHAPSIQAPGRHR